MRLLNAETFDTEEFFGKTIPPYTILSHTWGDDKDEISFQDIKAGRIKNSRDRPTKLVGCCEQPKKDGLKYTWVDTCCIDKASAVELSEAINSMYQWYADASVCYAYLSDVPADIDVQDANSAFISSRWFTRGWTLQELLAPGEVHFYSATWSYLGSRGELSTTIQNTTGIARPFLLGLASLHEASVAQRMSWASRRVTKRKEDMAYCLLGIFDVMLPMIYGEGDQAFVRLVEEIIKHTEDDSILAWGFGSRDPESANPDNDVAGSILATNPLDFANCVHVVSRPQPHIPLEVSGGRLRTQIALHTTSSGKIYGLLNCGLDSETDQVVGIPLAHNASSGLPNEYFRLRGHSPISLPATSVSSSEQIQILMGHRKKVPVRPSRKHWFYIEDPSQIELELIEVNPLARWQKARSIITTDNNSATSATQRTLARFRQRGQESYDFIALLEFGVQGSSVEARSHAMICSRDTTLEAVSQALDRLRPKVSGKENASNGVLNLAILVTQKPIAGQAMFMVKLVLTPSPPLITIDATEELKLVELQQRITELLQEEKRTDQIAETIQQFGKEQATHVKQTSQRLQEVEESLGKLVQEKAELVDKLAKLTAMSEKNTKDGTGVASIRERLRGVMSVIRGDLECVSRFHTKEMAASGDHGEEVLLWAAAEGHTSFIEELLTVLLVDIESKDTHGLTPLFLAARNGHDLAVQLLLEKGADIYTKSQEGSTPLDFASKGGHQQTAKLLLDKSGDRGVRDLAREPPVPLAEPPSSLSRQQPHTISGTGFAYLVDINSIPSFSRSMSVTSDGNQSNRISFQNTISLTDMESGSEGSRVGLTTYCRPAIFSPNGQRLAIVATGPNHGPDRLHIWESNTQGQFHPIQELKKICSGKIEFVFSPDGQRLAISYLDNRVVEILESDQRGLFQQTQKLDLSLGSHQHGFRGRDHLVGFSHHNQRLVIKYWGSSFPKSTSSLLHPIYIIQIWDSEQDGRFQWLQNNRIETEDLRIALSRSTHKFATLHNPDLRVPIPFLRTVQTDKVVRIWESDLHKTLRQTQVISWPSSIYSFALSPDGRSLAISTSGAGGAVQIWGTDKHGQFQQMDEISIFGDHYNSR